MKFLLRYCRYLFLFLSGSLFAQAPSVTVLTPNGGEVWSGATTQNITWSSVNIANVILEYSTNNGSTWLNIATWPASAQTYAWVVPGAGPLGSNQCLVRIYDALNNAVTDQSNAHFTIPPSSISLLQPNGGEQWPVGTIQSIVWSHNSILNIDIEYSTNNGANWISIATGIPALRGFYTWVIPSTISSNCILRVKDAVNPTTVNDVSNAVFSIIPALTIDPVKYRGGSFDGFSFTSNSPQSVTVLTPNGGENWAGASTQNITWSYNNIPNNVLIEVSYNNGSTWSTITTWPASAQTFPWVVSGPGSTQCRIRISDAQNTTINDQSNSNFTIPTATITLLQPNGGEQWPVGSLQSIVWNAQSVNNVNIDYSTNNGANWISIATNQTAQRGFYNWTIPATVSSNCLVRVTDVSNSLVTDNSNSVFSIISALTVDPVKYRGGSFDGFTVCTNSAPSITVLTPNGGEVWSGATTQNITWSYNNISNNVLIEYSTNNGSSWNTITTWPVTAGTYPWQVPGAGPSGSTQCLVRVSDAQNTLITDRSNATFTIPGSSVAVVQPNGGEQWPVGSLQSIVWNVQSVLTVNIEYSTNNGASWTTLATNYQSAIGFYNWVIPNNVSNNCLVRVSDFSNVNTVTDNSNSVFSIITALTVDANKYRGGSYDGFTVSYTGCVPPSAVMTGTQTICNGGAANLSINFTGTGPYVITYTNGTTPVTVSGITANPYVLSVTPVANTSYSITALSNTCVTGPVSGSANVTVTSGPTATLSGNQTICTGNAANLTVVLGGASPWTVVWTDGTNQTTQTGLNSSPWILNLSPTASTTYSLVSVSSPSCSGGLVSGTAAVNVQGGANASLSGGASLCVGNTSVMSIALSGSSPWTVVWTDGTSNTTQIGVTANPYLVTVTPSISSTYSLVSVSNTCGSGGLSGTAIFTIIAPPVATLTGTQTICAGGSAQLSIALTGVSPWSVSWTDGTSSQIQNGVTANPYILTVTPAQTVTYSLVSVSNACLGSVSGTAVITTNSGPSAVLSGNNTICGIGSAQLSINLTGVAPWSVSYSDGTNILSQTNILSSPAQITVSPIQTTTYTLTGVSSSGCPSGTVSGSAVVIFSGVPTASMSGSQTVCSGISAILTVSLSGGIPYTFTYTDGITPVTISGITSSPYFHAVTPVSNTTYSLVSVLNYCTGTASGQSNVVVLSPPSASISGTQTLCGSGPALLSIAFAGSGPWNVVWTDGTTPSAVNGLTQNPYILSVTPTGVTTYSLVSVSSSFCSSGSVSGVAIVNQMPAPTAVISGTQSVCSGQPAQLSISLTGTSPWNITWTNGVSPVTVNGILTSPYIFNVSPLANTTYTLSNVSDACGTGTSSGNAIVSLIPLPVATMSGNQTICVGSSTNLTAALTGNAPWTLTWTDGLTPVTITGINSSPYVWSVTPSGQTTYSLVSVSGLCTGTASGSSVITLTPGPSAVLSGTNTICPNQPASLSVTLTGIQPWSFTWTDGLTPVTVTGINSSPYIFNLSPVANTTYTLTQVSTIGCSSTNVSGNAAIAIRPAVSASISGTGTICVGQSYQFSVNLNGTSPWTVSWSDGTNTFTQANVTSSPYTVSLTPAFSRTYTLVSVSNICGTGTLSGQATVSVIPSVSATMSGSQTICSGNGANLSVTLSGSAPWNLTWTDGVNITPVNGVTSNPYIISVSPTAATTYVVLSVNANSCTGSAFGSSIVQVLPASGLVMSGSQNVCAGIGVPMNFNLSGNPPWNITFSNGTTNFTLSGISSSPYVINLTPAASVTYTPVSVSNACGNGPVSGSAVFNITSPGTAQISGSQTICPGGSTQLSVNLTGSGPWNFSWTNGMTPQSVTGVTSSPWVVNVTPSANTTYSLLNMQSMGCAGTVSGSAVVQMGSVAQATISGAHTICAGSSALLTVNLTGNAPWNLTWSDGVGLFTQTGISSSPWLLSVSPVTTTTYSLNNLVSGSCPATVGGAAVVTLQSGPSASISGSQTVCLGTAVQYSIGMTGTGPWDISWSDGLNTFSQTGLTSSPWLVNLTPAATRTYTLLSVSEPSCSSGVISGSGQIVIALAPQPSPAVVSATQSVCTNTVTITANTPTAGTGQWSVISGTGTVLIPGSPVSNVTSLSQGVNSFVWTVTLGSCSTSAQLNVFRAIPPTAAAAGSSQAICGSTVTLSGNAPINNGTGTWTLVSGGGSIQNLNSPNTQVNSLVPGVSVFRWTISNGICPSTQDTVSIYSAMGVTNANAGSDQTVCAATATLNGNIANPGFGLWSVVTGTGVVTNPSGNSTQITGLGMGTTILTWTLTNAGCVSRDTIRINRITAPTAAFTYSQSGSTFNFTDASVNPVSWYWTFGDGGFSTVQNPQHTYSQSGVFTVTLIVANGCGSDTSVQTINNWGVSSDPLSSESLIFEVWPNPASGIVHVRTESLNPEEVHLEVMDVLGHKVLVNGSHTQEGKDLKWVLDLQKLSSGVYWLRLRDGDNFRDTKLILSK